MSRHSLTHQSAHAHVRALRPQIKPNRSFQQQLLAHEQELFHKRFSSLQLHGSVPNLYEPKKAKAKAASNNSNSDKKVKMSKHKSLIDLVTLSKRGSNEDLRIVDKNTFGDFASNPSDASITNKKQVRFKF